MMTHREVEATITWSRFSRLRKLKGAVAYMLRMRPGGNQAVGSPLSADELLEAEGVLVRLAQRESYLTEVNQKGELVACSTEGAPSPESTKIDESGCLRLEGRVTNDLIEFETRNPMVLDRRHPLTALIIQEMHERLDHANRETVINELRQRFHVAGLRSEVKRVMKRCQVCRITKARPRIPLMGCFPDARSAVFLRPFTHTAVDFFGPIIVTVGRRNEKRYGVLFTCMTTRAVHLEIAHSLDTDSCVMAIKNFIARRGRPVEIWSDNGTNFKAASGVFETIRWKFNPPAASHMRSVFERLIRSVKVSIMATMKSKPSDEVLRTALLEAESLINMRPLTYIPVDPENPEALTPNHFLLGHSSGHKTDCPYEISGTLLRRSWLNSQRLADLFWRRWLKEYLPVITRRTKWTRREKPIEVGDLVVIFEEGQRGTWRRGRVERVMWDRRTEQVRSVVVRTAVGTYHRPVSKVAVLDVGSLKDDVASHGGGGC